MNLIFLVLATFLALSGQSAHPKVTVGAQSAKAAHAVDATSPFGLTWIIGGSGEQMKYVGDLLKEHHFGSMAMGSLAYSLGVDPKDTVKALRWIRADKKGRQILSRYDDFRLGKTVGKQKALPDTTQRELDFRASPTVFTYRDYKEVKLFRRFCEAAGSTTGMRLAAGLVCVDVSHSPGMTLKRMVKNYKTQMGVDLASRDTHLRVLLHFPTVEAVRHPGTSANELLASLAPRPVARQGLTKMIAKGTLKPSDIIQSFTYAVRPWIDARLHVTELCSGCLVIRSGRGSKHIALEYTR